MKKYEYKNPSLYIAQVKKKLFVGERKNCNLGDEKGIVPHYPPEKEDTIKDARGISIL